MMNLIMDYDGTIHDSIKIYAPAFQAAYAYLVSLGIAENKDWKEKEISRWLGFSSKDMWNAFMPDLSKDKKEDCSKIIGDTMLQLVQEGKARLYPQAPEVLQYLCKSGYTLIFLSNCKRGYLQAHREQFQLDQYFTVFYCTEDYGFKPKHEIFDTIKKDHSGDFIVIGDRFQDIEIARKHGLKSVGCSYGYGEKWEFANSTAIASQINHIPLLIKQISQ
jgi:phosphoglycolate phosphatase